MKNSNRNKKKRPLVIAGAIFVIFVLFPAVMRPVLEMNDYRQLLDADVLNVYRNRSPVGTFETPGHIMDTFNYSGTVGVGVGVMELSHAGLRRSDLVELYTLEFLKDNKVISRIRMFTPKAVDKHDEQTLEWFREFDGKYVLMYERGYYFTFGQPFYDNLSKLMTP